MVSLAMSSYQIIGIFRFTLLIDQIFLTYLHHFISITTLIEFLDSFYSVKFEPLLFLQSSPGHV